MDDVGPAEQLGHTTMRIECDLTDGKVATGTGFFYELDKTEAGSVPVVITNKHVVKNAVRGRFLLTLKDASGKPAFQSHEAFQLDNFESRWIPHPNPAVDLCAMGIAPLMLDARKRQVEFFFRTFDKSFIPTKSEIDDMTGTESVAMVGYPNGLWDQVNNMPIFRRGVLASVYKYDWNGKKEFLIDAACFPGSSGSPVMLFDLGGYQTLKGTFMGASRVKLLGVLYAGPQHTVEGEIRVEIVPTQQRAIAISGIPNNLGVIIKSEELLAFEGLFPH
jgi:hypothetical protein